MTDEERPQLDFRELGNSPEGATGWPHPVTISIHPRGRTTLLNISLSPLAADVGGQIPVTQAILDGELNEAFAEEFDACEARWLVPYPARLATGEDLTGAYRSRFGRRPNAEWSADRTF